MDAWKDSGKVYGYSKLHDDLIEQGQTSGPNRIARLALLAGIRAEIGYKRKPSEYGAKPSIVVDNNLERKHVRNGMLSPVDFENRERDVNQEGV